MSNGVHKSLIHVTVFLRRRASGVDVRRSPQSTVKVLRVFLAGSSSRLRTRFISCCLCGQLLQELNEELDSTDKRCVFLGSQQLGVHVLIGFQRLLILVAVIGKLFRSEHCEKVFNPLFMATEPATSQSYSRAPAL